MDDDQKIRKISDLLGELVWACRCHYDDPDTLAWEYRVPFSASGNVVTLPFKSLYLIAVNAGVIATERNFLALLQKAKMPDCARPSDAYDSISFTCEKSP